ncbi:MAG: hypothetical protein JWN46_1982 [Acidimicrobiales bacterium]|nr:hypothetical protein [Acidimicrobiales bacterium]
MRAHPTFDEKWLQQLIVNDPSILGLGELEVKDVERSQPRAGRLDLLLQDPDANTRYEVELQLGSTDESHIIRTIEYWDIERRRYPQYEHVGVIVAEDITSRFFNVISLFNGFIPLVAIQASALEVNGAVTVVLTKVLDTIRLAVEEEEEDRTEPRDRSYWESKGSPATLAITDRLVALARQAQPKAQANYNKNYIGITADGVATNFMLVRPRRQHVVLELRLPRDDEMTQEMEEAGLILQTYQARWGAYRLQIHDKDLDDHSELLGRLIKLAHAAYGSPK